MTQEIEIEYKNLLTKEEFNLLLATYPFPKNSVKQINYYFETSDFLLKQQQCALRIREKNGIYRLTLKEPHTDGILETHHVLSKHETLYWINNNKRQNNPITDQLGKKGISLDKINYIGSLTTYRHEVVWKKVLLVLDYSAYNGYTDHEFELEAPYQKLGLHLFKSILSKHQIPIRETEPKIKRFFDTLK